MTSTTLFADGLPFVVDLVTPLRLLTVTPFLVVRKLEDSSQTTTSRIHSKDVATSDTGYDLSQDTWLVRETVGPADYSNSLLSHWQQTVRSRKSNHLPQTQKNNTTQVANFVISNNSRTKKKAVEVV